MGAGAQVEEIERGSPRFDFTLLGPTGLDRHKPVRFGIRQSAQRKRVGHGEDGGVAADAERQRRNRNSGEAGIDAEEAKGLAQILHAAGQRAGAVFRFRDLARETRANPQSAIPPTGRPQPHSCRRPAPRHTPARDAASARLGRPRQR